MSVTCPVDPAAAGNAAGMNVSLANIAGALHAIAGSLALATIALFLIAVALCLRLLSRRTGQ
jgi:hypothetical protein